MEQTVQTRNRYSTCSRPHSNSLYEHWYSATRHYAMQATVRHCTTCNEEISQLPVGHSWILSSPCRHWTDASRVVDQTQPLRANTEAAQNDPMLWQPRWHMIHPLRICKKLNQTSNVYWKFSPEKCKVNCGYAPSRHRTQRRIIGWSKSKNAGTLAGRYSGNVYLPQRLHKLHRNHFWCNILYQSQDLVSLRAIPPAL